MVKLVVRGAMKKVFEALVLVFVLFFLAGVFAAQCNDSVDNESDGFYDSFSSEPNIFNLPDFDPNYSRGCTDASDNSENTQHLAGFTQCSDGVDNDSDGKTDYRADGTGDTGCFGLDDELERDPVCYKGFSVQGWQKAPVKFNAHRVLQGNDLSGALGQPNLTGKNSHTVLWGKFVVQNSDDRVYSYGPDGCVSSGTGFCGTLQCTASQTPSSGCCSGDWSRSISVRGIAGEFTKILPGANPSPQDAGFGAGCQYQHLLDEYPVGNFGFNYSNGGTGTYSPTVGVYNAANPGNGGSIFVGTNDSFVSDNSGSFGYEIWECGPLCGDKFVDKAYSRADYPSLPNNVAAEECDNGFGVNSDSAPNACRVAKCPNSGQQCCNFWCGDKVKDSTEQCDDGVSGDARGDAINDGLCIIDNGPTGLKCKTNVCGDGYLNQQAEECDDGNPNNGDGCSSTCTIELPPARCGDSAIDAGEECDNGAANSNTVPDACRTDVCPDAGQQCCNFWCGDKVKDSTEQCDGADRGICTAQQSCSGCICVSSAVPVCVVTAQPADLYENTGTTSLQAVIENADSGPASVSGILCGNGGTTTLSRIFSSPLTYSGDCGPYSRNQTQIPGFSVSQINGNQSIACDAVDLTVRFCGDGTQDAPAEACDDGVGNGPDKECSSFCAKTFCGDGTPQSQNGTHLGGPLNDGKEDCDGLVPPGFSCNDCALVSCLVGGDPLVMGVGTKNGAIDSAVFYPSDTIVVEIFAKNNSCAEISAEVSFKISKENSSFSFPGEQRDLVFVSGNEYSFSNSVPVGSLDGPAVYSVVVTAKDVVSGTEFSALKFFTVAKAPSEIAVPEIGLFLVPLAALAVVLMVLQGKRALK